MFSTWFTSGSYHLQSSGMTLPLCRAPASTKRRKPGVRCASLVVQFWHLSPQKLLYQRWLLLSMHAYISAWSLFRYITQLFSYSGHILLWFLKMFLLTGKKWLSLFFLHFFSKPEAYFSCLCFEVLVKKQYAGITFEFWAWFNFNISNYPIYNEKIVFITWKSFLKPDLLWNSVFTHHHPACSHPLTLLLRSVTVTWSSENTIISPRNLFWTLHKPKNFLILNVMSTFGTSI